MEQGDVMINRENNNFIHIKEITRYVIVGGICNIVTGNETTFFEDAKTNIGREVHTFIEFTEKYRKMTNWEIENKERIGDINFHKKFQ